ncbi:MAG: co-chaperone DjlA [Gammaproteobacteria bacterium]|nr:co-chaperone DjlA [Gammaproteobacteria bacterium]
MSWWGKLAGGGLGFALGGPLGAMIGVMLGHQLDKSSAGHAGRIGFDRGSQERTQAAFFTATFSVMGCIAKADGHVSPKEIQLAEQVVEQMRLNKEQRKVAVELFNQGRQDGFMLDDVLEQFRAECQRKTTLIQMFIEIQLQAAYADGVKDPAEERLLHHICNRLGYPVEWLAQLESITFGQQYHSGHAGSAQPASASEIRNAHRVLGVDPAATEADVKKAYRRLMSQHHPDKLISKGLPEEMIEIATEKTQEIRKAYELIQQQRKTHH